MYPNISRIRDDCLKNGFKLQTNLSEVRGNGMNLLIASLKHCSMQFPNKCIIERVIYEHPHTFRTPESIKDIMKNDDPVTKAFTVLGLSDLNCNIRWLLKTLLRINEMHPVRNILATAPPRIKFLNFRQNSTIKPGETIQFEIQTISEAQIQWWKNFNGRVEIIMDHIRIPEYSTTLVPYKTKDTDKGFFYVEVNCLGGFRESSPEVYVGTEESIYEDRKKYDSCTYSTIEESRPSTEAESSEDIVPSRESDSNKRVALLVGIMNYNKSQHNVANLYAPESDILDLERVLLQIGFTVYSFGDLEKRKMIHILETFAKTYKDESAYVFFYFAGHGNSSNKTDNIHLTDLQMPVSDVLKILLRNKPKVLVSIFDMCRDDCSETNKTKLFEEATVAHAENLILVMSTLPKQKSFEKKNGHQSTSLIMKTLCEKLIEYGCKDSISIVLTRFVNSCENVDQQPTILFVGTTNVIGIDIPNRRIKPIIEWLKVPEDRRLMSCVTVDFKIFHNILIIYVNNKSDRNIVAYAIRMPPSLRSNISAGDIKDSYKVSLFNSNVILEDHPSIEFIFDVETPTFLKTEYNIKVHFPSIIVPFLSVQ